MMLVPVLLLTTTGGIVSFGLLSRLPCRYCGMLCNNSISFSSLREKDMPPIETVPSIKYLSFKLALESNLY
ncbi:hypothetical protein F5Y17DRAFT_431315, partial [Xylariaceae sp. FL0594]